MGYLSVLKKLGFIVTLLFYISNVIAKPHYASIVMEYPSLQVLYSESPGAQTQPASLTKVMTLYLVFKALDTHVLKWDQALHVSAHAANRQPSKLGLKVHDTLTVNEAICGLVTKSANDAAAVLAESLALTEEDFANQMTGEARRLGMVDTTFKNASGIADKMQLTTAKDMAILGAAIMRDFPHYYHYFSLKEFDFKDRVFKNHNHLLGKYQGCDGIKTGYTTASGFNLLSSATRNNRRLIGVVLGGESIKSRDLRMMQILDLGFALLPTKETEKKPHEEISMPSPLTSQIKLDPPTTIIEEY